MNEKQFHIYRATIRKGNSVIVVSIEETDRWLATNKLNLLGIQNCDILNMVNVS